jgi:hypothetical protein
MYRYTFYYIYILLLIVVLVPSTSIYRVLLYVRMAHLFVVAHSLPVPAFL